jgi:hypothetical protein
MHSLLHASLHFVQYNLKKHQQEKLVTIAIPLQDFDNDIAFKIEADEWKWHDDMYDIVSSYTKNGIVYATAFKDGKDKNIAQQEKKQQEKKKSNSENNILLFCETLPLILIHNFIEPSETTYVEYNAVLRNQFYSVTIPPPNYC